jgi:hypothetical protein
MSADQGLHHPKAQPAPVSRLDSGLPVLKAVNDSEPSAEPGPRSRTDHSQDQLAIAGKSRMPTGCYPHLLPNSPSRRSCCTLLASHCLTHVHPSQSLSRTRNPPRPQRFWTGQMQVSAGVLGEPKQCFVVCSSHWAWSSAHSRFPCNRQPPRLRCPPTRPSPATPLSNMRSGDAGVIVGGGTESVATAGVVGETIAGA